MTVVPAVPLVAEDPTAWLDAHHASYFRYLGEVRSGAGGDSLRTHILTDLFDEDLGGQGVLRRRYDGELAEGWQPQAAITGVVGSYAGVVAGFVGYLAFASGAHWLVSNDQVKWIVDGDGWPLAITLADPAVLVAPDHPWAGQSAVDVEPDSARRAQRCIASLVEAVEPIVDAGRAITRVGRAGLWNSVADAIGHAVMYQDAFAPAVRYSEVVRELLAAAPAPWKARPDVRTVTTDFGEVCVVQRGGCCLVYTGNTNDDEHAQHNHHEEDETHARFYELFVDAPGAPGYCNDCSLRTEADCFDRLVWWRTEELRERSTNAPA